MEEKLEKNWKKKIASALGAAALAIPITTISAEENSAPKETVHEVSQLQKRPTLKDFSVPFGEHSRDDFLRPISFLESSGGKNTNHALVDYGMHKGDTAIGKFALMPKTVKNVAAMLNSKQSLLRKKLGQAYQDPEIQKLQHADEKEIANQLKTNKQLALRTARYLATHLHQMHDGDKARMAFGWRFGHNLPSHRIPDDHLNDSGYVKKFKKILGHEYANQ